MTRIFDPPRRDLNLSRRPRETSRINGSLHRDLRIYAVTRLTTIAVAIIPSHSLFRRGKLLFACTSVSADRIFCSSGSGLLDLSNRRLIRGISTHSFLGIDREAVSYLGAGSSVSSLFRRGGGFVSLRDFHAIYEISRAFARL